MRLISREDMIRELKEAGFGANGIPKAGKPRLRNMLSVFPHVSALLEPRPLSLKDRQTVEKAVLAWMFDAFSVGLQIIGGRILAVPFVDTDTEDDVPEASVWFSKKRYHGYFYDQVFAPDVVIPYEFDGGILVEPEEETALRWLFSISLHRSDTITLCCLDSRTIALASDHLFLRFLPRNARLARRLAAAMMALGFHVELPERPAANQA